MVALVRVCWHRGWLILLGLGLVWPALATEVTVQGLFNGSAVLTINGQQKLMKVGGPSVAGVSLVSANSKMAVVEIDGQRHQLAISQRIASDFSKAQVLEVRIQEGRGGHYYTPGRINGVPVDFLIDTGATTIAMNKATAERLGVNYRAGKQAAAYTAGGMQPIFLVNLARVSIGGIIIDNVEASVHLDESPPMVLLGNSFLKQLEMKKDNGVLVLSSQQ